MNTLIQLIAACLATMFFSLLFHQPMRAMVFSGIIAAVGYGIFLVFHKNTVAYFLAALFIGIACELLARFFKMTATLFITSSIIPLVPGLGLYRTMFSISQGQYTLAGQIGTNAVEGICAIALAITFSTMIFTNFKHIHSSKNNRTPAKR